VTKKSSAGISSRGKFALQCVLAGIFTVFFLTNPKISEIAQQVFIPFSKEPLVFSLGWGTFIFYLLVIVGTSNAVNLTDGLDGLATGCTATVAATYAILVYIAGNLTTANYLKVPYVVYSGELTVLCVALLGACLGFLWWNAYPARVFMGDTGSLAIGGMLGAVAICCKQEILLVIVGGIFVIEAMSVILQVASFKLTGKRIIKMSPIHHHYELSGWKENTVIVRFWIMSVLFALLGLATLKLR
jgi:phospho-N-acetylmuramoyl-pentapeptide-transferase